MTPVELAKYIDHTLLAPEATSRDIAKLCQEANEMNVAAICCSPSFLPLAQGLLSSQIAVACVVGFPDEQIIMTCRVAVANGADFVKTSTGFHKSGGATVHAVELMRSTVGASVGVKASGGIRSRETAVAMINAGASRIGTSASAAILAG